MDGIYDDYCIFDIFFGLNSIWEHPNHGIILLIFRSNIFYSFLCHCFPPMIVLEKPRTRLHVPYVIYAWEQSNPEYLTSCTPFI